MNQVQRLQNRLHELDIPAMLVTHMGNVSWATGFKGSFGALMITGDRAIFLTDSRYTLTAKDQVKTAEVESFSSPLRFQDFLAKLAKDMDIHEIGFEPMDVSFGNYSAWQTALEGIVLKPVDDFVGPVRSIKTPEEIEKVRKACKIIDGMFGEIVNQIKPGKTEVEVLEWIHQYLADHHSKASFDPIVATGNNSARPHMTPGDTVIADGDFVTIDAGAVFEGYVSDVTRTYVVGKASDRHKEVYDQVLKALDTCKMKLVPGANGKDIDQLARDILDEKDLAQYFGHSLGHGLGSLVHDYGRLSVSHDQPIKENQVWTVEPGVYIEGFGGVRIEDDVLVTSSEPEILTNADRHLIELA